jgi:hypothetical protein
MINNWTLEKKHMESFVLELTCKFNLLLELIVDEEIRIDNDENDMQ